MQETRREQLLSATMSYVAEEGLSSFSLRSVAAAIGTSHRMLSHHFGSKSGLEGAIVERATELLTAPLIANTDDASDLTPREYIEQLWAALSDPELEPLVRLYFDLSSRAMVGDEPAMEAVSKIRDHWTQTAISLGNTDDSLVGAAVMSTFLKGLLLDRLSGASLADTGAMLDSFLDLADRPRHEV